MDHVRALIYGLLCFCASSLVAEAFAFPPTQRNCTVSVGGATSTASTCQQAYHTAINYPAGYDPSVTSDCSLSYPATSPCRLLFNGNPIAQASSVTYSQPICPAGTTGTTNCTCNAPTVELNGACVSEQAALCGALSGQSTYATAAGRLLPGASSCSAIGCNITYSSTVIVVKNAQGQQVTEGDATITSTPCTYSAETGSADDTCKGGTEGQLNGVTVCVPYDPDLNTVESFKETDTTSSNSDGDSETSSSSSSTTCTGNSCTTTTTNNTTVNGVPKTSTESKTEDKADYCRDNPRAPQCGEAGTFTGSCQASFVCSGDAIQCAAAKAVNEQLCKFKDAFEVAPGTQAASNALTNGTDTTDPKLDARIENLGNFDQTNPLSGACPVDANVTAGGQTFVIPFSQACGTLQVIGNLAVAFTLLGATLFVLKGLN